jgi:hypothetical protein
MLSQPKVRRCTPGQALFDLAVDLEDEVEDLMEALKTIPATITQLTALYLSTAPNRWLRICGRPVHRPAQRGPRTNRPAVIFDTCDSGTLWLIESFEPLTDARQAPKCPRLAMQCGQNTFGARGLGGSQSSSSAWFRP